MRKSICNNSATSTMHFVSTEMQNKQQLTELYPEILIIPYISMQNTIML